MSPLAYGSGRTNFYYYDHARRLVKETHTCTGVVQESSSFVYDGLDIVAKVDNLTGEMIYFTRGLGVAPGVGDVLAESHIASNGSLKCTYLYVQNHRGDTIALVSNSTVVARYEYSAWGQIISNSGVSAFFTFSGKHYDSDAGLYYYGYRWYDAQAKRWTQPDPSGLAEGLDLYQFCGNDPVNGVDVYGLDVRGAIVKLGSTSIAKTKEGKILMAKLWQMYGQGLIKENQGGDNPSYDGKYISFPGTVNPGDLSWLSLAHEGTHALQPDDFHIMREFEAEFIRELFWLSYLNDYHSKFACPPQSDIKEFAIYAAIDRIPNYTEATAFYSQMYIETITKPYFGAFVYYDPRGAIGYDQKAYLVSIPRPKLKPWWERLFWIVKGLWLF
jgi:RHS repeat-associated protein